MGVSGSGKSTVGSLLAAELKLSFVDGDDLHPPENKKKMAAGIALNDADRVPWLDAIAAILARGSVVVACSALKRRYRDRLRAGAPELRLIYLQGTPELLAERLSARQHEFMPAKLLDSQLATLEEPGSDEGALAVDVALAPGEIVSRAAAWYRV
jgi:carbohydrate kinase (thermoresistant glucokinase family)